MTISHAAVVVLGMALSVLVLVSASVKAQAPQPTYQISVAGAAAYIVNTQTGSVTVCTSANSVCKTIGKAQ
jgi:hypothetical protein